MKHMSRTLAAAVFILLLAGAAAWPKRDVQVFTQPLYAQMQTQEEPADSAVRRAEGMTGGAISALPWLRIEVETSYGWFWQRSVGKAYTTRSKENLTRVPVGTLCVQLVAHDTTQKCLSNVDSIVVEERKRGLSIPKRTAYLTAWAENPTLDTLRVQLAP